MKDFWGVVWSLASPASSGRSRPWLCENSELRSSRTARLPPYCRSVISRSIMRLMCSSLSLRSDLRSPTVMASFTKVKGRAPAIDAACSDFLSSVGLQFYVPQSGAGNIPPSALVGVLLVGYRAFPELERCFGLGQEFYCCNRSGAGQLGSAIGFFYVYGWCESDDAQRCQAL